MFEVNTYTFNYLKNSYDDLFSLYVSFIKLSKIISNMFLSIRFHECADIWLFPRMIKMSF